MIAFYQMMEMKIIVVEHVILQNVVDLDGINATLKMIISKLNTIINVNKQKDTEENIRVDARLLIGFEFYVVIMYLRNMRRFWLIVL